MDVVLQKLSCRGCRPNTGLGSADPASVRFFHPTGHAFDHLAGSQEIGILLCEATAMAVGTEAI